MRTPLLLVASLFLLTGSVRAQQQDVVQQKSDADFQFHEKARKPGKPAAKTVGGNYRYGAKTPPAEMRENPKQPVMHAAAPPVPAPAKDADPGKPLSGSDATAGVLLLLFGLPLVIPIAATVGKQALDEAEQQKMFGGKP